MISFSRPRLPLLLAACILILSGLPRQARAQDRIYLKNGRIVSGLLVEEVPPISLIRVQMSDSSFQVYDMKEVYQIFRGAVQEGYWDRISLKEGAVVYGFITLYQAGREVVMEVPGNKKVPAVFSYLEIDRIERVPIEEAAAQRRNKSLVRERLRSEREPRSLRYLGEYGIIAWQAFSEWQWNFSTNQVLLFDFSSRYALGMGLGLDFNPSISNSSLLGGNSVFAANRYYFSGKGFRPYLLADLGYDFVRDGLFFNSGVGMRVSSGNTRLNFSLSLRLQQTDIWGNAQNSLSIPDPPKMLEIFQFRIVLE